MTGRRAGGQGPRGLPLAGLLFGALALVPVAAAPLAEPARRATVHEVKAAFVLNALRFAEWREGALPPAGEPLVLAIDASEGFTEALLRAVDGQTANGRPLRVVSGPAAEAPADAAVLLLGHDAAELPAGSLEKLEARGVLTMGCGLQRPERLAVRLIVRDRRLRFAVDLDAAERSGLRFSSHMLRLAEPMPAPERPAGERR